jgi:hypothetical protein
MSRGLQLLVVLLIALTVIQFIQPARNQSGQASVVDISTISIIPDTVYIFFKNTCFDCHSNNTIYPWYSNIQPFSWIIARDIENGKAKLNFNDLGSLSARRQVSKLRDMENRIKDGSMPPPAYKLMHGGGRLTDEERGLIIDWIDEITNKVNLNRSHK